jgi:hypothetical protein
MIDVYIYIQHEKAAPWDVGVETIELPRCRSGEFLFSIRDKQVVCPKHELERDHWRE